MDVIVWLHLEAYSESYRIFLGWLETEVLQMVFQPMGVFTLLDEDCLMPNTTDKSFVEKLVANHKESPIFKKPPR